MISFYKRLPWPGNYRQLKGHLQRKAATTKGCKLSLDQYDQELTAPSLLNIATASSEHWQSLQEIKGEYAFRVYQNLNKNITQSSKVLQITPSTMRNLLKSRSSEISSQ